MSKVSFVTSDLDLATQAMRAILKERAELIEQQAKLTNKIAELSAPNPRFDALKLRKQQLHFEQADLLADAALDSRKDSPVKMKAITDELTAIRIELESMQETQHGNRLLLEAFERRLIDCNTSIGTAERRIHAALRELLTEQAESDVAEYEKAAEAVRKLYPKIRAAGVWISHLDGSRFPLSDGAYRHLGGSNPILPSQLENCERLVVEAVQSMAGELSDLLPGMNLSRPICQ